MSNRPPLTKAIAAYAVGSRYDALPGLVQAEAVRAFVNWVGVTLGGCRESAVLRAAQYLAARGGNPQASVIGRGQRSDPAGAAFANCIASSVLAFDDAHPGTIAHPSGPAAASLFAIAQSRVVSGSEFLNALALGIEVQCRIAKALVQAPAPINAGFYVNGISGPVGVATAVGRLTGLDAQQMAWAIGIAASEAGGFRATHGTMTAHFRAGHAAQAGVVAALLAAQQFDCTEDALEAPGGFFDVYAPGSDLSVVLDGLGSRHEMLENRYKPYPCGVVIHPVIDACRELKDALPSGARITRAELAVHPLVLSLTGKRHPGTPLEAHNSVFHWAAVTLMGMAPGLDAIEPALLSDPRIGAFRDAIAANIDPGPDTSTASVRIILDDGTTRAAHVTQARGSRERPMSDAELDAKFIALADRALPTGQAQRVLTACRETPATADVGQRVGGLLP